MEEFRETVGAVVTEEGHREYRKFRRNHPPVRRSVSVFPKNFYTRTRDSFWMM